MHIVGSNPKGAVSPHRVRCFGNRLTYQHSLLTDVFRAEGDGESVLFRDHPGQPEPVETIFASFRIDVWRWFCSVKQLAKKMVGWTTLQGSDLDSKPAAALLRKTRRACGEERKLQRQKRCVLQKRKKKSRAVRDLPKNKNCRSKTFSGFIYTVNPARNSSKARNIG